MPSVYVNEVAPRDGLQSAGAHVPTAQKILFVNALSQSGVDEVEVSAFVSPKWIPQLGDAQEVFRGIRRVPGVAYSALVPNARGLERALECKVDKISVFTATSETFNQRNINASIDESIERMAPVVRDALASSVEVRGYSSTCFWCPYEGQMPAEKTVAVMKRLADLGVDTLGIADTTGQATKDDVSRLLEQLLLHFEPGILLMHFHDTYGHAADCVRSAYEVGVRRFDSSSGGIGGCPFAPGAKGNIATERLVDTLQAAGADVEIARNELEHANRIIEPWLVRAP